MNWTEDYVLWAEDHEESSFVVIQVLAMAS
jgi:hypothetical protein